MRKTAKLFRYDRSQAVRLPPEFRFEGSEVYVRRDPETGDVILSRKPNSWGDFFELMKSVGLPEDFLEDIPDLPPQQKRAADTRGARAPAYIQNSPNTKAASGS